MLDDEWTSVPPLIGGLGAIVTLAETRKRPLKPGRPIGFRAGKETPVAKKASKKKGPKKPVKKSLGY